MGSRWWEGDLQQSGGRMHEPPPPGRLQAEQDPRGLSILDLSQGWSLKDRKIYFIIQVMRLLMRLVPRLWQEGLYSCEPSGHL